jgi:hypothetical protein
MPSALVDKYAREGKGSKESLEKKWREAKEAAKKSNPDDFYALTTSIFEKMVNASVQKVSLDKIQLNAARRLLESEQ